MRHLLAGTVAVLALAGCGTPAEPPFTIPAAPDAAVSIPLTNDQLLAKAGPGAAVLVVHANGNHVTGNQPASCVRTPAEDPDGPARICTPGSVRDDVDPAHMELTVCKPGWSDTILPPSAEFARAKTAAMRAYGVSDIQRPVTEYDHDIPRSLGGSNDVNNLWPQVSDQFGKGFHNTKDEVETRLHAAVCKGKVRLVDAQWAIAANWRTAEATLGIPHR